MNAAEQKALLAILHDGDLLAAIDYVEGACKPSKPKATGPAPLPRKIPKWPEVQGSWPEPDVRGGIMRMTRVPDRIATAICKRADHPARVHLAVAPCGCTLYPDQALQCAACIKARSADACRALIEQHDEALRAFGAAMGFTAPERRFVNWDFMVSPHNGYYGLRDKVEVA